MWFLTKLGLLLNGLSEENAKNLIIAYEPIWAIGTGKTATSDDANEMCMKIREEISKIYGNDTASCVIILYGR